MARGAIRNIDTKMVIRHGAVVALTCLAVATGLGIALDTWGGLHGPANIAAAEADGILAAARVLTCAALIGFGLAHMGRARFAQPGRGAVMLRVHPLATAMIGGVAFLVFLMSLDTATRETLEVNQILEADKPRIDGDLAETVWRRAKVVRVPTQQGSNLDGTGQSFVEIRAVHDGLNAYMSFVWEDPTRSVKHVPMQKRSDGWYVLQDGFDKGDANAFHEDKLAVLMLAAYVLIPGDRTFHAGRQPLPDKPATFSGRGMHYTTSPGAYADMWQWRAANGGLLGWVDDNHFGPPAEPTEAQRRGQSAYKGGFISDPGSAFYTLNFEERGPGGYANPIKPKRLPRDLARTLTAMGKIDLDPHMGEEENSVWWLTDAESVPYSEEADARIPVGTIIPGVLITGTYGGDRAHIRGSAKWSSGRWTLETVRRLDTGSKYDAPIANGTYLRVAVFDHTQARHTRFIRPIRIEVNRCEKPAECKSTTSNLQLSGANSF